MKLLTLGIALLACSSAFAQDKPTPLPQSVVTATADHTVLNGPNTELKGNVEIKSADFVIQADEAIHYGDTREIEAHGNMRLKSAKGEVKSPDPRMFLRSPGLVLVTGTQSK